MKIILLGPPGAGKGTQASKISKSLHLEHLSTGNMLRENVEKKTDLGIKAYEYMKKGLLVPDDIINSIVKKRILDLKDNFILDGYPRNIEQAKFLESFIIIDFVIYIDVMDNEIIKRLSNRYTCRSCHSVFNQKLDKCPVCGSTDLYIRDDDKEEVVKKRLEVYRDNTQPLVEYYIKNGLLYKINGNNKEEEVLSDILNIISSK